VPAVLLRVGGQDPLVLNAEAQPPHVELRQAVNAGGGEGHPVVGTNRTRQPVLAKQPVEDGADADALRAEQAMTGQQIASVLVGDRQRVTVDPIAGAEVALEVGCPEIVGLRREWRDHAGMLVVAPAAPLLHQAAMCLKIAGSADRGPLPARLSRPQPAKSLAGPQLGCCRRAAQISAAGCGGDSAAAPGCDPSGRPARRRRSGEPFVSGLATDVVAGAQFGHGIQIQSVITNEPLTLFHG
jgi:hypothetical protein